MSLFRTLFGETDATGVASLLSPEQRSAIDRQSMMALGAKLLQASGRSPQRINTSQAIGGALQAALEAQQAGQMNAVQQMLLGQKIQEARETRDRNAAIRGIFSPATAQPTAQPAAAMPAAGAPLSPEQALLAGGVGRPGPTMQRAELTIPGATMPTTAQPATQPAAPMGLREFAATLPLAVQQSLQAMEPNEALKALNERYNASSKFGNPEFFMRNGKMIAIQRNELGEERERPELAPRDTPPSTILEYEYATKQGYQGSLQQYIIDRQRAGASTTTVKLPPGPNEFVSAAGKTAAENLQSAFLGAQAANNTLRNIDLIVPALDTAVLGPAADYRTTMLRVGQQLGIAGENADQVLANTRQVVQGLARAEVDAAASMRGQGQITDTERVIIRRMAAGDQNMTAAELRTGMAAMQKLSNQRLTEFQGLIQTSRGVPGFEQIAPMYQITPYQSQFDLSRNLNLGNAVQQELQRRRTGGR